MNFSTVATGTVGAVVVRERSNRRSSAASSSSEENTVECLGRNTLVPSTRRNAAGDVAGSGGVNRSEACSAASAIIPTTASRSCMGAKRQPIVCRAASAIRFHLRQVERFSPTTSTTLCLSSPTASSGTSSARSSKGLSLSMTVRAQAVASRPSTPVARARHSLVRSASDRTSFSGRVDKVA